MQRMIDGDDVRVHVVGDAVIACRFSSDALDYRSDRRAERSVVDIPDDLARLLVALTAEQDWLSEGGTSNLTPTARTGAGM